MRGSKIRALLKYKYTPLNVTNEIENEVNLYFKRGYVMNKHST